VKGRGASTEGARFEVEESGQGAVPLPKRFFFKFLVQNGPFAVKFILHSGKKGGIAQCPP